MENGQIWKIFEKKNNIAMMFFFLGSSKQVTMKYLENVLKCSSNISLNCCQKVFRKR